MAMAYLAENLKEELICPVCRDYFSHPVTLGCGHSFCRLCLLRNWGEADQPCPCPECKRNFQLRDFEDNRSLEKLANLARHVKPYLFKIKEETDKCRRHGAEQNLFCEEDQVLLCEFCLQTPEHSRHTVHPIEKAAVDSRDRLQKTLDHCWKEMETVENMLTEERKKENSWKAKSRDQRESLTEEYRRFHELLQEEEQRHLDMLAKQESDHLKSIRKSEVELSKHLQNLREVMGDIEQNCQKLSVQLLQVVGYSLTRSESLLGHRPETVTTPENAFHYTLMWEMLTHFKVDVTLDPESACPYHILSDDLKTVVHGGYQQTGQIKDNIVLGAQVFISGIHYWEVDVGDSREWTVGACKESLSRDGDILSVEDVFLLSYSRNGDLYTLMTIPPYIELQVHVPIHRVGIFLDCDKGTISFYDALNKCFIYRFPNFLFPGPLRPFFSPAPPLEEERGIPMTIRQL